MIITRIAANPAGFDRALDAQGRRWGPFINLNAEYVEMRNQHSTPTDMSGWTLRDAAGHAYTFPQGTVAQPGATIRVRTGEGDDSATDLFWNRGAPIWNNLGDTAFLYDSNGTLISQLQSTDQNMEQPIIKLPSFRAQTDPSGPAIDIMWDLLDPTGDPDSLSVRILRRERRFPGLGRRGVVPVDASADDLLDGDLVYDSAAFAYDFEETWEEEKGNRLISTARQYLYRGTPRDRLLVRSIRREFPLNGGAPTRTTISVIDRDGLVPGNIYYYTAFVGPNSTFSRMTQASALATGQHGYSLFTQLPQIHQRLDTVTPPPSRVAIADVEKGQLQRLIETLESHTDMLHGTVDGLRDLHNPRRVDSRVLPHLARMIGWRLKDYLDEDGQRNEVIFAPEVYRTVGTIPNIVAMINRLTGWDARVREFATNILLTFDASRLERLDFETVYLDGTLKPNETPPPFLQGRSLPPGTVDTTNDFAMFKLRSRAFDDQTAYTYDCGRPNGIGGYIVDNDVWFNRETIGLYIVPDVETETFSLFEEWERVRQILAEFLPIQVRAVFVLLPDVVVEEPYDATQMVTEEASDLGIELKDETYGEGSDDSTDTIPQWQWFVINDLAHLTVDTVSPPLNLNSRTWHTGISQGL